MRWKIKRDETDGKYMKHKRSRWEIDDTVKQESPETELGQI